jgi:hypothetical protein
MSCTNRSRRSVLPKLCLGSLFALVALVPSLALARTGYHQASSLTFCYPNAQTCTRYVGTEKWNSIAAMNMPWMIESTCSGNPTFCTMTTPQDWTFDIDSSPYTVGPYSVSDPAAGISMSYTPGPNLPGGCAQTSDAETYYCIAGTGGPGWSAVYTVQYF